MGLLFVAIGAAGAVLPLLPVTPFMILAAFCFSRSSPRLHAWLINSRLFGPGLRRWDESRCISRQTRNLALAMLVLVGGSSVLFFIEPDWLRLTGVGIIGAGLVSVLLLKVCPDQ